MSISTLPEWKQLLLKRKRQEEEERERKEREEEKRLASMPAWKRGIIQKRRAKQDIAGQKEREKDREGEEPEHEPYTSSISSIQQNPFIRLENSYRRRERSCERRSVEENLNVTERKREKEDNRGQNRKICGREDKVIQTQETVDAGKDRIKGEVDAIPTIKAENIIIIEEKSSEKVKHLEERDVTLNSEKEIGLREILFAGGRLTEIRASEVLIIRPTFTEGWSTEQRVENTEHGNEGPEIGRVSLLISKFGQNRHAPCRSKSSDCFTSLENKRQDEEKETERKQEWMKEGNVASRGVPKRSFSFSERVMNARDGFKQEGRRLERSYSDRRRVEFDGKMKGIDEETNESGSKDGTKRFNKKSERINTVRDGMSDERCGGMEKEVEKIPRGRKESQIQLELQREVIEMGTDGLGSVKTLSNKETEKLSVNRDEKHQGKIHIPRSVFFGTDEPGLLKKDEQIHGGGQDEDEEDWDEERMGLGRVKRAKERWNSERHDEGKLNKGWGKGGCDEERLQDAGQLDTNIWDNKMGDKKGKNKEIWDKGRPDEECFDEAEQDAARMDKKRQSEGKWSEEEWENVRWDGTSSQENQGRETCEIRRQDDCRRVERKKSWKTGRPLTRVDSLKERIRQREREEKEKKERAAEMDGRQEVALPQTFSSFDVTREVSKEELPVSVPASLSAEKELFSDTERHGGVTPGEEKDQDEDLLEERYILPSSSPSLSPSPTSESYLTMSRIYNLKPVSSRTGGCLTERNSDVQTRKIHPGGQFAPGLPKIPVSVPSDGARNKEISPLYSVQRQVEQINLKKQEVLRHSDGDTQKTSGCESNQDQKTENNPRTSSLQQTVSAPPTQSSPSTKKTIRPENDPVVITSPSRPLFTIRSASGGPGRKGTTITITPKKFGSIEKSPSPVTSPKTPDITSDQPRKRFPTAEEIEVIGGYKNLERSCLVKNKGSPKTVRVCFDDSQLESVCTYPSEDSVVGEEKSGDDWSRTDQGQEDKCDDDDDDDSVITGKGMSRVLRVATYHPPHVVDSETLEATHEILALVFEQEIN